MWLGGRERNLTCRASDDQCWLQADGYAPLVVDLGSGIVSRDVVSDDDSGGTGAVNHATDAHHLDGEDLIVGPALALVLAARGTFCLHASAVAIDGRARLFLGDSGVGKSTLVRDLPAGVARVADDIVPCTVDNGSPRAWPAYPQLKLSSSAQFRSVQAGSRHPVDSAGLCIDSISVLDPGSTTERELVAMTPLAPAEATLALARHSVAAKLFPPPLLDAHLDACVALAQGITLNRVRLRRGLDHLPDVRRALFM